MHFNLLNYLSNVKWPTNLLPMYFLLNSNKLFQFFDPTSKTVRDTINIYIFVLSSINNLTLIDCLAYYSLDVI